jgi:hypothetical protein
VVTSSEEIYAVRYRDTEMKVDVYKVDILRFSLPLAGLYLIILVINAIKYYQN